MKEGKTLRLIDPTRPKRHQGTSICIKIGTNWWHDFATGETGNSVSYLTEKMGYGLVDSGQAQYELYKASDVEPDANGSYKPKAGASPLTVRTADLAHGKITYDIPEYILNGSSTKGKSEGVGFRAQNPGESDTDYAVAMAAYKSANIEDDTRRELETGITTIQHDGDYVLVFRGNSANDWQNSVVKLSCVANALQKRNTGNDTWTTIKSETITFGGMDTAVVPVETTISDGNATAANAGTP